MSDLRDLYQEVILDHSKKPRNFGKPTHANHTAQGHNPLCGDRVTIYLDLAADGKVKDVTFEGSGCAISMASASIMTEMLKGKTVDEAKALFEKFHGVVTGEEEPGAVNGTDSLDLDRLEALSGVREFPMRVKCATLAWHTFIAATEDRRDKVVTE
jgi:nitrogen fixation protein NifU and related proteins